MMIPDESSFQFRSRIGVAFLLMVLMLIGFWLRVRNLGVLGLEGDEGHQALAVQGILEYGYPQVPSGKVYTRGMLFLYSEALSAKLTGWTEFALRLPSVLYNLGSIFVIFHLGRRLFGVSVGLVAALMLTFSVWEIELSRNARMYPAFQLFYLATVYSFYRGFIEGSRIHRYLTFLFGVTAWSLHSIGILLVLIFIIPFLIESYTTVPKRVLVVGAILLCVMMFAYAEAVSAFARGHRTIETVEIAEPVSSGRTAASRPVSVPTVIATIKNGIKEQFNVPPLNLIVDLKRHHGFTFYVMAIPLVTGAIGAAVGFMRGRAGRWKSLFLMPLLAVSVFHQAGLFVFLALVYGAVFLYGSSFHRTGRFRSIMTICLGYLVFWMAYGFAVGLDRTGLSFKQAFFGFPPVYQYFLRWYIEAWPVFIVITLVGIGYLSIRYAKDRTRPEAVFLAAAILLPLVVTSLLKVDFYEARYTFHLYPLLILVFVCVLGVATRWLAAALNRINLSMPAVTRSGMIVHIAMLYAAAMVFSGDIYPTEAYEIGNRTHVTERNPVKAPINARRYARIHPDFKSPALYMKRQFSADDIVIVVGAGHRASIVYFYTGHVDYILDEKWTAPIGIQRGGRTFHHVTGAEVITDAAGLRAAVDASLSGGKRIWLYGDLTQMREDSRDLSGETRNYLRQLTRSIDYIGDDRQTFVVLINSAQGLSPLPVTRD